jgi:DNA-binding transcriptional MerR regulator
MKDDKILTASEAARLLRCSAESVRRFEKEGLLHANKTESGTRIFLLRDVERFADRRKKEKSR